MNRNEIETLADRIISDGADGVTLQIVDALGRSGIFYASKALKRVALNETLPLEVREQALNHLLNIASRAIGEKTGEEMKRAGEETGLALEDLRSGDSKERFGAAFCLMVGGGRESLEQVITAMRIEGESLCREIMIQAGRAILARCSGELGEYATKRAGRVIDAVEALHWRGQGIDAGRVREHIPVDAGRPRTTIIRQR